MSKIHVTAKRDFLESLTVATPIAALSELVWNGFDAQSDRVQIHLDVNALGGLETIRVRDYGNGINHAHAEKLFGSLGESWKKNKPRDNGRALHGKSGKGRFKAFALGNNIEWNTTFKNTDGKLWNYKITGQSTALDDFDIDDPKETNATQSGTEVTIFNLKHEYDGLLKDKARQELTKKFAVYLTEYPILTLDYNGYKVNPASVQSLRKDYPLQDVVVADDRTISVALSIIEWSIATERAYLLCDSKGISLYEIPVNQQIRAPGFNFTSYIKTDYFRELDKQNQLIFEELNPDTSAIIEVAKVKIKEHFRKRLVESQSKIVDRWKEEQIYPYDEKTELEPVEAAERQVFDILAVNVEDYLPSFETADIKSKKFTFRLLAQAIRENPDSLQEIIVEVLGLKKEAQDDLAELLRKTSLTSIISSAKIVADRLNFLVGLGNLLFDKETKGILLERDQLHKILEKEAWLFDEDFCLSGSEKTLEEVLQKHITLLGKREDDDPDPVLLPDGKRGRVDLMFSKVVQPRIGEYDYLIVELKRPSQKIDADVLTQIEKYAIAVANDERFNGMKIHWKFMAISNSLDPFATKKAIQRNAPKGRVYDDSEQNITVWAKEWAEVINDAKSRLTFVNKQLNYQADRDSAKEYLMKTHVKFIPTGNEESKEETVNKPTKKSKIKKK